MVFVSNGLDFYIDHILRKAGFADLEFHASITEFTPSGMKLRHRGPDDNYIDSDVKAAYADSFIEQGYDVVYLGDGRSDLDPARRCTHIFATGSLISYCEDEHLSCITFNDFYRVMDEMESLL